MSPEPLYHPLLIRRPNTRCQSPCWKSLRGQHILRPKHSLQEAKKEVYPFGEADCPGQERPASEQDLHLGMHPGPPGLVF